MILLMYQTNFVPLIVKLIPSTTITYPSCIPLDHITLSKTSFHI